MRMITVIILKILMMSQNRENIKLEVNVIGCAIGKLLSDQYPLLKKIGFGYYLNSIGIYISPKPDNSDSLLFGARSISQPRQINQNVEYLTNNEKNIGLS